MNHETLTQQVITDTACIPMDDGSTFNDCKPREAGEGQFQLQEQKYLHQQD
jgi:hypothetical protein